MLSIDTTSEKARRPPASKHTRLLIRPYSGRAQPDPDKIIGILRKMKTLTSGELNSHRWAGGGAAWWWWWRCGAACGGGGCWGMVVGMVMV